jgi:hypothetical protein
MPHQKAAAAVPKGWQRCRCSHDAEPATALSSGC